HHTPDPTRTSSARRSLRAGPPRSARSPPHVEAGPASTYLSSAAPGTPPGLRRGVRVRRSDSPEPLMRTSLRFVPVIAALVATPFTAAAQERSAAPAPVTPADYGKWESLGPATLSP